MLGKRQEVTIKMGSMIERIRAQNYFFGTLSSGGPRARCWNVLLQIWKPHTESSLLGRKFSKKIAIGNTNLDVRISILTEPQVTKDSWRSTNEKKLERPLHVLDVPLLESIEELFRP
ncbi:unnamed protein product [Orchesella dallaii]|uniref:Uncharacterized protein n=1 Tax=Orchesella dallaii TaxID=48710 RepID=A0ABP1PUC1_9HEXA